MLRLRDEPIRRNYSGTMRLSVSVWSPITRCTNQYRACYRSAVLHPLGLHAMFGLDKFKARMRDGPLHVTMVYASIALPLRVLITCLCFQSCIYMYVSQPILHCIWSSATRDCCFAHAACKQSHIATTEPRLRLSLQIHVPVATRLVAPNRVSVRPSLVY